MNKRDVDLMEELTKSVSCAAVVYDKGTEFGKLMEETVGRRKEAETADQQKESSSPYLVKAAKASTNGGMDGFMKEVMVCMNLVSMEMSGILDEFDVIDLPIVLTAMKVMVNSIEEQMEDEGKSMSDFLMDVIVGENMDDDEYGEKIAELFEDEE